MLIALRTTIASSAAAPAQSPMSAIRVPSQNRERRYRGRSAAFTSTMVVSPRRDWRRRDCSCAIPAWPPPSHRDPRPRPDVAHPMVAQVAVPPGAALPVPAAGRRLHRRAGARAALLIGRSTTVKFRVELVWTDGAEKAASSIFLTADGRVILQGRTISPQERQALALPADGDMISVDRDLIRAIKDML